MHVFARCIDQRSEPVQWCGRGRVPLCACVVQPGPDRHKIQPLQREMAIQHSDIEPCPEDTDLQHELLNKLARAARPAASCPLSSVVTRA